MSARLFPLVVAMLTALITGRLHAEPQEPTTPSEDVAGETTSDDDVAEIDPTYWRFAGLPRLLLSTDNGIGAGGRFTAVYFDGKSQPYKTKVALQLTATIKLVQDHYLSVDTLRLFNLPLRAQAVVGLFSSSSQNYCGRGPNNTCDAQEALFQAGDLEGEQREEFLNRYYLLPIIRPFAQTTLRYAIDPKPHQFEVFAGWRGHFYLPGAFDDYDGDDALDYLPFPGSRYAQDFPEGERGLASVLYFGAIADDRDSEIDPTHGYFLQSSVRASSSLIGSNFNFVGINAAANVYAPLVGRRVSLASRFVVDHLVGAPPTQELARPGGLKDTYAFGGKDFGRGIRVQRYLGKTKIISQQELRFRFPSFTIFKQHLEPAAALFMDIGSIFDEAEDAFVPLFGYGFSLRLLYNKTFPFRFDVGFSPLENNQPFIYTGPGFVF